MLPSESPEAAVQTDLEAQEPDEGTHHIIGPISIPCKRIRELSRRTSTVLFNASNLGSATRPAHVTFLGCVAAVRASYDREVLFLRKIIIPDSRRDDINQSFWVIGTPRGFPHEFPGRHALNHTTAVNHAIWCGATVAKSVFPQPATTSSSDHAEILKGRRTFVFGSST
ncbi:hypothetical protein MAP00_005857 [Monascus purpureus]|nr:hypothetical protein MAP00_005857 [Monascus purpureus]